MTASAILRPRMPTFPDGSSAIEISPLDDASILLGLRAVVDRLFDQPAQYYAAMPADGYRKLVSEAQDEINRQHIARQLAEDRRAALVKILGTNRILLQTNLYLRATRPTAGGSGQEFVGWHRESFYGPDMIASVNFWLPVRGVTPENTLHYVPDSHLIPEDDIQVVQESDSTVERFSAGHRIGLLYAPKRIVGGVDFKGRRPFIVPQGSAAIFAGALIHGAAENHSNQLRFSVDFRLIAADNLTITKEHFASGKSYFEPL
jgi:ectoine hydroxylase-related dioxygenase (phytanoyl-CoA dioxygenase family)